MPATAGEICGLSVFSCEFVAGMHTGAYSVQGKEIASLVEVIHSGVAIR